MRCAPRAGSRLHTHARLRRGTRVPRTRRAHECNRGSLHSRELCALFARSSAQFACERAVARISSLGNFRAARNALGPAAYGPAAANERLAFDRSVSFFSEVRARNERVPAAHKRPLRARKRGERLGASCRSTPVSAPTHPLPSELAQRFKPEFLVIASGQVTSWYVTAGLSGAPNQPVNHSQPVRSSGLFANTLSHLAFAQAFDFS